MLQTKKIEDCYIVKFANLLSINKYEVKIEVKEEEINQYIEFELQQHAYREPIVKRTEVVQGDLAVCEYKIVEGTNIIKHVEDARIRVGSGMYDVYLENAIQGLSIGKEHIIDWKVPNEVEKKEWAGKKLKIYIMIKQLYEVITPTINEYLLKEGFSNISEYKRYVSEQIVEDKRRELEHRAIESVIDEIIEKSEFKIDDSVVAENGIQYYYHYSQIANVYDSNMNDILVHTESSNEDIYEVCYRESLREVQRYLVLGRYAKIEQIKILDDELEKYCLDNDIKKEEISTQDVVLIKYEILEEKVIKHIKERYVVIKER